LTQARHRHEEKKAVPSVDGVTDDWGKTRPFWCLNCGRGYKSVERVFAHYADAGHGNESMSVGSRGLTGKQQMQAFRSRYK
jgi:hypothetical protein